jgi:uncharacterized protein YggE
MKNKAWMGALIALVVVAVLAWAIGAAASGRSPKNQPDPAHVITVSGGASVSSAPDEAIIRLGVRTENADSQTAEQGNNQKAADVMKALTSLGIADKDIQTTQISLNPHIQDRGTNHETKTYVAENQVAVTVHDLTQVGAVVSQTVAAGANVVGGIEFQLSDLSKARENALAKAVDAAHAKATALAEAAGTTLGAVVRIDENSVETRPQFEKQVFTADVGAVAMPSPAPVSPQNVETNVDVTVVWELG